MFQLQVGEFTTMFLRNAASVSPKSRRRASFAPGLDVLEGRKLLSVASPTFTYYPDGHVATEVAQDDKGHTFNDTFNEAGQVTHSHVTNADGSLFADATYGYD